MTSELETNIVSVERTKEYSDLPNEVCIILLVHILCVSTASSYSMVGNIVFLIMLY